MEGDPLMPSNIYPTRRRKNFVKSQTPHGHDRAYFQHEAGKRISYFRTGGICTQLANECEMAGWIDPGPVVEGMGPRRWWSITASGRALDKSSSEEKSNG
jgi:hypothetical protein